jgi:hypothetical protein
MHILRSAKKLDWGELSLPVWGLDQDFSGGKRERPLMYSLAEDGNHLWFVAASASPAQLHPQARPGMFLGDLWKYDVAELFIADPVSGRYLEFHLAANGAWWSGEFVGIRQRATTDGQPFPEVQTHAEISSEGGWMVAMVIPIDLLQARIGYGAGTAINVCFLADSPATKYYSVARLTGDRPNFHQPQAFSQVVYSDWSDEDAI